MHILKALQVAVQCSHKQAKQWLRQGRVQVNGETISHFTMAVDGNWDQVTLDQEPLTIPSHHYWVLNKKPGYLSARRDPNYPSVLDLVEKHIDTSQLSIVGRLDRDACGIVLLTDNGQLHYVLENPYFSVAKTYRVIVNGPIAEEAVDYFNLGVRFLDGYQCQPAQLKIISTSQQESTAEVTIIEGKRHQVKKCSLVLGLR
ncbi:pseudouridine synthase [Aerococcus kribbianus]|uniref:Pseudouridine synthase n=1 Tax=Aerococcus kribbianus TaxID=2999064 RepID=A0A9X3FPX3_9LACT|nr:MULTISPECIES: pseudouridine synthase [unclassified Aerococcus]MCZ0717553.1 pseudouridine synthase [Aerococcus sp. YH-aer221]MCZ0725841.1 pseudouridine synthase [Aerococcus sp. YH-aer222]